MGNIMGPQRMVVERLITNKQCHICLGVVGQKGRETNPYKDQVIRVGEDGPLRSMVAFQETEQFVQCTFEGGIILKFMKRGDDIVFFLSTPEFNVTDTVRPIIRQQETIQLRSEELDRVFTFMRMNNNQANQ